MKNTSLCYIFRGEEVLLLHKTRKGDGNYDKWLGVGGKFLENESPLECALREAKEETGLTLINPRYRARITFISDRWESEIMHLFTCEETEGELIDCDEGELLYLPKDKILSLPHWEGDKIFLELITKGDEPFFELLLEYEGETLKNYELKRGSV
ncbi:MAG: 8-oxo-dGTP diphosphatase [Clostridia bacterium]|nr:8-oxo-dGTP diphosphatase [Clostridia bacterium]